MEKESNIKIYVTDDYDAFQKMLGNRDAKSEAKIISSIQQVGQVVTPIIVNEKMEVIDGQNRLNALKALGLPVYYIKQKGLDIEACRCLNVGQTNWGTEDYIASFAEEGNKSYLRLASLVNAYRKPLSIKGIIAMANPTALNEGGTSQEPMVKKGKYELTESEYELAVKRIDSAIDLGYAALCKRRKYAARIYWACVSYIYQNQSVNAADVIKKLEARENQIPGANRVSEQLSFMDDAINCESGRKSKVFLSTDFQKGLYMESQAEGVQR